MSDINRRPAQNSGEAAGAGTLEPASSGSPPVPPQGVTAEPQAENALEEALEATAEINRAEGEADAPPPHRKPTARVGRREILEGSVWRGVFVIALPSVATMLLQTTNQFLDRFFVGHLEAGPEAQAAITTCNSLMFALMSAAMAISVGTTALVARFLGEENIKEAEHATHQSVLLTILISLAIAAPMWFLRGPILSTLGLHEGARDLAMSYLSISLLGLPTLFLSLVLNGTFRGMGDTARPFWVTLGQNGVHAVFNYLLIFGHFGFPKMGLPGGALALVLSQITAAVLYAIFLLRSPLRDLPRSFVLSREWATRISRIGLPASGQQLIRVGSMLAFQSLLARSGAGDAAVAALGVGLVSESIAFMPGFGYSIAASAYVGQNLGARQVRRAQEGAWAATLQAVAVMTVMGLVFYMAAEPFARLFIPHLDGESAARAAQVEQTIGLTVAYLRIAALSEPFLGLGMVLTGALQGAGETISPTWITIGTMILLRLPLAYFLLNYSGLDTIGGWWAMSISTAVQGLATVYIFNQGRWRTVRV